ncbi:MAG: hypothetical protein LBR06_02965 [Bacteroidales bacterium]|nr:hypothetical protein [Bacteroidales bacterium]
MITKTSVPVPTCYRIAGHLVEVEAEERNIHDSVLGLPVFRIVTGLSGGKPLLRLDESAPPDDGYCRDGARTVRFMAGAFACALSCGADEYRFSMSLPEGNGQWQSSMYCCDGTFHARIAAGQDTPHFVTHFSLWIVFGVAALHRDTAAIHASAVMHGGRAVLCLGESGTGKSTHTRLWTEHIPDTELLNDDSPFITAASGESRVYGSPWSGKTPCYRAIDVPLAALVRIRQASFNHIRRLSALEAIGAVLPSFPPEFACDSALSGFIHSILSAVLCNTPVYLLECLPDAEAAWLAHDTLKRDGRL